MNISLNKPEPVEAVVAAGHAKELAIEVNSLSKTYTDGLVFRKKFPALKQVSFNVNRGEIFGLLGPNGAGKTTFLKILLGIIRKSSGNATMLGFQAGSQKGRELVGYLPEHLRVPPHMTGYTALECFGNLSNIPTRAIKEKQGDLLALVGLADRGRDRVKKYSKGMVQRLGLAQALLNDPKLLVLDEPTDGLDPRARAEMRQVIRKLADKGVTIFLNSHLLGEVEVMCDRVAILNRGELKYCGGVREIGEFLHSTQGDMVSIEVQGDVNAINASFAGTQFEILERKSDDRFLVSATAKSQDEVNALIDAIRKNNVSLLNMEKKQLSLEDAFLQIVDEPASGM